MFVNVVSKDLTGYQLPVLSIGHLNISDSAHPPRDAVPSTAHLLPPTATPTHIPLPGEDEVNYSPQPPSLFTSSCMAFL